MNEEEINTKVAEAMGWRIANPENTRLDYLHWTPPGKRSNPNTIYTDKPPRFVSDLNACAEFEKTIAPTETNTDEQLQTWGRYEQNIRFVTLRDGRECGGLYERLIRATAPQRCEAFLRTIGKWEDQP